MVKDASKKKPKSRAKPVKKPRKTKAVEAVHVETEDPAYVREVSDLLRDGGCECIKVQGDKKYVAESGAVLNSIERFRHAVRVTKYKTEYRLFIGGSKYLITE